MDTQNKRLKVEINRNMATLCLVDKNGNGFIVLKGPIGGCDWIQPDRQKEAEEVLLSLRLGKSADSLLFALGNLLHSVLAESETSHTTQAQDKIHEEARAAIANYRSINGLT
jgi:hypothetical protein